MLRSFHVFVSHLYVFFGELNILPWILFEGNTAVWSRCALHSSEPVGQCFSAPRTQCLKRKQHFCLTNPEYLQSLTWWENTLVHFPLLCDNKFYQVFVFSERNKLLAIFCWKVLWQYSFSWSLEAQIWKSIYTDHILSPRSKFTQLWNCRETCFVNLELRYDIQNQSFTLWNLTALEQLL